METLLSSVADCRLVFWADATSRSRFPPKKHRNQKVGNPNNNDGGRQMREDGATKISQPVRSQHHSPPLFFSSIIIIMGACQRKRRTPPAVGTAERHHPPTQKSRCQVTQVQLIFRRCCAAEWADEPSRRTQPKRSG